MVASTKPTRLPRVYIGAPGGSATPTAQQIANYIKAFTAERYTAPVDINLVLQQLDADLPHLGSGKGSKGLKFQSARNLFLRIVAAIPASDPVVIRLWEPFQLEVVDVCGKRKGWLGINPKTHALEVVRTTTSRSTFIAENATKTRSGFIHLLNNDDTSSALRTDGSFGPVIKPRGKKAGLPWASVRLLDAARLDGITLSHAVRQISDQVQSKVAGEVVKAAHKKHPIISDSPKIITPYKTNMASFVDDMQDPLFRMSAASTILALVGQTEPPAAKKKAHQSWQWWNQRLKPDQTERIYRYMEAQFDTPAGQKLVEKHFARQLPLTTQKFFTDNPSLAKLFPTENVSPVTSLFISAAQSKVLSDACAAHYCFSKDAAATRSLRGGLGGVQMLMSRQDPSLGSLASARIYRQYPQIAGQFWWPEACDEVHTNDPKLAAKLEKQFRGGASHSVRFAGNTVSTPTGAVSSQWLSIFAMPSTTIGITNIAGALKQSFDFKKMFGPTDDVPEYVTPMDAVEGVFHGNLARMAAADLQANPNADVSPRDYVDDTIGVAGMCLGLYTIIGQLRSGDFKSWKDYAGLVVGIVGAVLTVPTLARFSVNVVAKLGAKAGRWALGKFTQEMAKVFKRVLGHSFGANRVANGDITTEDVEMTDVVERAYVSEELTEETGGTLTTTEITDVVNALRTVRREATLLDKLMAGIPLGASALVAGCAVVFFGYEIKKAIEERKAGDPPTWSGILGLTIQGANVAFAVVDTGIRIALAAVSRTTSAVASALGTAAEVLGVVGTVLAVISFIVDIVLSIVDSHKEEEEVEKEKKKSLTDIHKGQTQLDPQWASMNNILMLAHVTDVLKDSPSTLTEVYRSQLYTWASLVPYELKQLPAATCGVINLSYDYVLEQKSRTLANKFCVWQSGDASLQSFGAATLPPGAFTVAKALANGTDNNSHSSGSGSSSSTKTGAAISLMFDIEKIDQSTGKAVPQSPVPSSFAMTADASQNFVTSQSGHGRFTQSHWATLNSAAVAANWTPWGYKKPLLPFAKKYSLAMGPSDAGKWALAFSKKQNNPPFKGQDTLSYRQLSLSAYGGTIKAKFPSDTLYSVVSLVVISEKKPKNYLKTLDTFFGVPKTKRSRPKKSKKKTT